MFKSLLCSVLLVVSASSVAGSDVLRAVCSTDSGMPTKYHQQGVEVWGGDFFYDGLANDVWVSAQDKRSGGSGGYTCYIEKVGREYPASVISALKEAK